MAQFRIHVIIVLVIINWSHWFHAIAFQTKLVNNKALFTEFAGVKADVARKDS